MNNNFRSRENFNGMIYQEVKEKTDVLFKTVSPWKINTYSTTTTATLIRLIRALSQVIPPNNIPTLILTLMHLIQPHLLSIYRGYAS